MTASKSGCDRGVPTHLLFALHFYDHWHKTVSNGVVLLFWLNLSTLAVSKRLFTETKKPLSTKTPNFVRYVERDNHIFISSLHRITHTSFFAPGIPHYLCCERPYEEYAGTNERNGAQYEQATSHPGRIPERPNPVTAQRRGLYRL